MFLIITDESEGIYEFHPLFWLLTSYTLAPNAFFGN